MAQVTRKWITDQAVNNQKIDPTDIYYMGGLVVDNTGYLGTSAGTIGIGTNVVPALDGMTIYRLNPALNLSSVHGHTYQLKSDGGSNFRIYDVDESLNRLSINASGFTGFGSDDAISLVHMRSTVSDTKLTLDMDDGVSGRSYQLLSNTSGEFQIYDLDAVATRFLIDPSGAVTITGDATVDGNFQVDGDVTVINTEIIVTDMLEINQSQNQPALIASQDAANLSVVVSVENAGSGPALTTTGNGISVGIGTATVVAGAALQVEGNIVGKLTASPSNIGSPTRRIGTIYMASTIDHASKVLCVSSGNVTMGLTVSGQLGLGIDPISADYSIDAYRASDFNLVRVDTGTSTTEERAGYEIWQGGVRKAQMTMGHDLCIMGSEAGVYYTHLRVNGVDGMVMDSTKVAVPTLDMLVAEGDLQVTQGKIGIGTTPSGDNFIDSYTSGDINIARIHAGNAASTSVAGIELWVDGDHEATFRADINGNVLFGALNGSTTVMANNVGILSVTSTGLNAVGDLEIVSGKIGIGTTPSGDNFIDSYTSGDINIARIHAGSAASTSVAGIELWIDGDHEATFRADINGNVLFGALNGSTTVMANNVGILSVTSTGLNAVGDLEIVSGKIGVGTTPSGDNFIDSYTSGDINIARIHAGSAASTSVAGIELWIDGDHEATFRADINGNVLFGALNGSTTVMANNVGILSVTSTGLNAVGDLEIVSGKIGVGTTPSGDNFIDSYTSGDINIARIHAGSAASTSVASLELWIDGDHEATFRADINGNVLLGARNGSTSLMANNVSVLNVTSTSVDFDVSIYCEGNISCNGDNLYLTVGASADAGIYYDGTDMVIWPNIIGTGNLVVRNNVDIGEKNLIGTFYDLADDVAANFTPGKGHGFILIGCQTSAISAIICYGSSGGTPVIQITSQSGSSFAVGTTTLSDGTTDGTDGQYNVNFNGGKIYLKNRLGST